MLKLFTRHSKDQHADSLADYLPNDERWAAKKIDGKNLRKLLLGFARQLRKGEDFLETVWEEIDPSTTTAFIDDWESAVGIPDDCFPGNGAIEDRRIHVVIKLSAAVQTAEDFEALALQLGLTVQVFPGFEFAILPYPIPFPIIGSASDSRFTIVVTTPITTDLLPFDIPFIVGDARVGVMQCIFNKLKPANVNITYLTTA